MKILLLGEFSALHKNLKEGLVELGHKVVVAASRDGFKKVPVDISFDSDLPGILGKIHRRVKPIASFPEMRGYDVVQLVNPFIFEMSYFPRYFFLKSIVEANHKFFLLGAGTDSYFWRYGRKALKYGPFDDFLKFDLKQGSHFMESDKSFAFNKKIVDLAKGVIPIMYEYEVSYESEKEKRLNTIPIPINTDKIEYKENEAGKKITIFHGLNRYGFKGTRHVEQAFEYLSKKHPNDLELIIDGKIPLSEYLDVMKRTNVVIDQMYSHSLGVNGVYALAMGKIVMGGAEPESLKSLGVDSSPVINLKPNAQSIIDEVEKLLEKRTKISELGFESRQFAERVHGHTKVAQQYVETWSK
ncbi:glycosyltransferase [Aliidiomarina sanyensis]|uniref:Glycosyltransferase n=1 Tax=Aliidiomarina sanyensis TaxID=1249555 RepID=A0A432WB78_9GAMM|nr:glycosyltransferase [Aliidiomarina sanyensis]RUO27873.1 glycosyltransferase [Aliidiomarina sanyensis]